MESGPQPTVVQVREARVGPIRDLLSVPGVVVPSPGADWTISAPDVGRVAELPKVVGDHVEPGDVLVRFDIPSITESLAARQQEVTTAATAVDGAQAEADKRQSLFDRGFISRDELKAATDALLRAQAALTQARASIAAVEATADRAVVKARFAGIVAQIWHQPGDAVAPGPSDPVLRVIDPTRVQVAATVTLLQLQRIEPGQEALLQFADSPDPLTAAVVLRPLPQPDAASAEIRISLPGATPPPLDTIVQATVVLDERQHALLVPESALVRTQEPPVIFVAGDDGLAHRRAVRVGVRAQGQAEITFGLQAGEQVIVSGQDALNDGDPIRIQ